MKLGYKIIAASGVSLLFLILLSALTLSNIKSNQQTISAIYEEDFRNVELSKLALEQAIDASIKTYRLFTWIHNLSESEIKQQSQDIANTVDSATATIDKLQGNMSDPESQTMLPSIHSGLDTYRNSILGAIDMAGVDINMGLSSMQSADEDFLKIKSQVDQLVATTNKSLSARYQEQLSDAQQMQWISIALVTISIIGSVLVGAIISRHIVIRIRAAIATAEDIAKGNLNHLIPITGQDEITQLLKAIAEMQEQLRQVVKSISATTTSLGDISYSIRNSSSSILESSETQNQSAATMAAAVDELSNSSTAIHELAEEANTAMRISTGLSQEEKRILASVIDSMRNIETSALKNSKMVDELGQESEKISGIVKVISDIAEQTNLLALNAAIEAARAGEQGRGFAVVADEVRSLAARTASSTREIANMISSIQKQVNSAVKGIQDSV